MCTRLSLSPPTAAWVRGYIFSCLKWVSLSRLFITLYIAPICLLFSLACCCIFLSCILSVFLLGSTSIGLPLCNPFLLDRIISIKFKGPSFLCLFLLYVSKVSHVINGKSTCSGHSICPFWCLQLTICVMPPRVKKRGRSRSRSAPAVLIAAQHSMR